jgi:hypothetical protein
MERPRGRKGLMDGSFGIIKIRTRIEEDTGRGGRIRRRNRGGKGTIFRSRIFVLVFPIIRLLLRGTHTPRFAHSAPMRARDFFTACVISFVHDFFGRKSGRGGPLGGAP